jgi:two-component sensor histidine kinase
MHLRRLSPGALLRAPSNGRAMHSPFSSLIRRWFPRAVDRLMFRDQFLMLAAMCVLLSLSYDAQHGWRSLAEDRQTLILHGWDRIIWFVWLAAAPIMLLLIRRFPIVPGQLRRSLIGLGLGAVLIFVVITIARFGLRLVPNWWLPPAEDLSADWATFFDSTMLLLPIDVLTFCGFFGISFAVNYHFESRRRADETGQLQLRAARLESELSQAELAVLRNQLQPHFLFNSFNAVATLMRQGKNELAVEVIAQLSALLRRALKRTGHPTVSLEEEMDFIRSYLDVEKVRFAEKLQVSFSIDPATAGVLVPNLVLQPLVENAIKHGISQRVDPGVVAITAARHGDRLALEIVNDGPDDPRATSARIGQESSTGIGLVNTHLRLKKLYGADYRFDILPRDDGGMCVRLDLPCQPAAVPAAPPLS